MLCGRSCACYNSVSMDPRVISTHATHAQSDAVHTRGPNTARMRCSVGAANSPCSFLLSLVLVKRFAFVHRYALICACVSSFLY